MPAQVGKIEPPQLGRFRAPLTALGGASFTWPLSAHAQQPSLPVVGFITSFSADASTRLAEAFRNGLNETGVFHGLIRMYDAYRPAEGVCSLLDGVDPRPAAEAAYAARASSA